MLTIRSATIDDVPVIYSLLGESARAQGAENELCADPDNLREDGFGPEPRFWCLLAESQGEAVGLALYFFLYSTWTSRKGIYLEDLYVVAPFRRQGVAKALMARLAEVAAGMDCGYIQWAMLHENQTARRFYESLGGKVLSEWALMRIDKLGK